MAILGTLATVGPQGKFTMDLELDPGRVELVIRDEKGQSIGKEEVWVDETDPTIEVSGFKELFRTQGQKHALLGSVVDASGVEQLLCNGESVEFDASGSFEFDFELPNEGRQVARFVAHDAAGRSNSLLVQFEVDRTAPKVILDQAIPEAVIASSYSIRGRVFDAHMESVKLTSNGEPVDLSADGAFTWEWPLSEGRNEVSLVATDGVGLTHESRQVIRRRAPGALVPIGCKSVDGADVIDGWASVVELKTNSARMIYVKGMGDIKGFYIGETEVTRAQYKGGDSNPNRAPKDAMSKPKALITVEDAIVWCDARELRMPTFEEWILAAGPNRFPWGDDWDEFKPNAGPKGLGEAASVYRFPKDRSSQGVLGLAGNVSEWCQPKKGSIAENFLPMGGSYRNRTEKVPATNAAPKSGRKPRKLESIGFRVVLEPRQ